MELVCYEKGTKCVCGTNPDKPWETRNYCVIQRSLTTIRPERTCCEKAVSHYIERLNNRIEYYTENATGLREDLKVLIYETMGRKEP